MVTHRKNSRKYLERNPDVHGKINKISRVNFKKMNREYMFYTKVPIYNFATQIKLRKLKFNLKVNIMRYSIAIYILKGEKDHKRL